MVEKPAGVAYGATPRLDGPTDLAAEIVAYAPHKTPRPTLAHGI
jgi:hypothetical protein